MLPEAGIGSSFELFFGLVGFDLSSLNQILTFAKKQPKVFHPAIGID
jgi:hypothetical protein